MDSDSLKEIIRIKFGDVWFLEEYYEIESLDIVRGAWVVVVRDKRSYIKNYIGGVVCHNGLYIDMDGLEWMRWGDEANTLSQIESLKSRLTQELLEI